LLAAEDDRLVRYRIAVRYPSDILRFLAVQLDLEGEVGAVVGDGIEASREHLAHRS